jgi:hypothetical protein
MIWAAVTGALGQMTFMTSHSVSEIRGIFFTVDGDYKCEPRQPLHRAFSLARRESAPFGKAGGCDGLADSFGFLVGKMEGECGAEVGEFAIEDLPGFAEDEIPGAAGGNAAEDEEMAQIVHGGVLCESITEIDADGFEDGDGSGIAFLVKILNEFELVGGVSGRQWDVGGWGEAHDGLLGEVLGAAADVTGPFIGGGVGAVIDGGKGEFVEPSCDAALRVEVTGGLTRAHGDAEECLNAEGHGAGECGDVAVVDDLEWNAPFLLEAEEEGFDV